MRVRWESHSKIRESKEVRSGIGILNRCKRMNDRI
jgi:hypothetical protein